MLCLERHLKARRLELRAKKKLKRKGAPPEVVDAALARLEELGYLNDEEYARRRAYVLAERGYGDYLILARLEALGLSEDIARAAVLGLPEELAEPRRLARLVEHSPGLSREKLIRRLAARGFPMDLVLDITNGVKT